MSLNYSIKGKLMAFCRLKNRFWIFLSFLVIALFLGNIQGSSPYAGYNFYANGKKCYLKDMKGATMHTWTSTHPVMSHSYLLRDSSVLFPYSVNNPGMSIVQSGGGFQIIKWDGSLAWDFTYAGSSYIPHHDCDFYYSTNNITELPTIITIAATKENTDGRISEKIVEIKPTGATTAEIIWQWFAYDHSISSGTDSAGLLDLAKGGSGGPGGPGGGSEWIHANSVHLNPMLNQLVVGSNYFNEFFVIDHSTTTAEAATHKGGKYGKGGDILYRWGNPSNYGCSGTQYLSRPHSACWIQNYMPGTRQGLPGAGHILSISNNTKKGFEVTLPGVNGVYPRTAGSAFEPSTPTWTVSIPGLGSDQGSIQRLPNGNTLICNGMGIGTFEYDSTGDTIWSLSVSANEFIRYDFNYLGSTLLDTGGVASVIACPQALDKKDAFSLISCEAFQGRQKFVFTQQGASPMELSIFTASGKEIMRKVIHENTFLWDTKNQSHGLYFAKIAYNNTSVVKKFSLYR
jgi:hypothetical protein